MPLGKKWACICAGNGCCVWCGVCDVSVFGCESMRYYVIVCVVFVVLLVAVDALAVVWW